MAFDPTTIPGCVGWWAARDLLNGGALPADGSTVTSWKDKSGIGNDIAGAYGTPTLKLAGINGLPTVNFPGASGLATIASTTYSQPNTYFIVAKITGGDPTFGAALVDGRVNRNFTLQQSGQWEIYAGTMVGSGAGTIDSNPHVVCSLFNGASSFLRIDGVNTIGNPTFPVNAGTLPEAQLFIGSDYVGHGAIGWISEVVMFNAALTLTQIQYMESGLSALYMASTATSVWLPGTVRSQRRMAPPVRRGRATTAAVVAQAAAPPKAAAVRRRVLPVRRGEVVNPVPPQAVPAPPAYPPQGIGGQRRRIARRSSSRPVMPVLTQTAVPTGQPARRRLWPTKRGQVANVVQTQVAPPPPAFPPPVVSTQRRRLIPVRRGRPVNVVQTQTAPAPPKFPPSQIGRVRRVMLVRRGKAINVVPTQTAPVPPSYPPAVVVARIRRFLPRKMWRRVSDVIGVGSVRPQRNLRLQAGRPRSYWTARPPQSRWRSRPPQ